MFADASTGEIDLENSASGDHTITYTVSVPGCTPRHLILMLHLML